MTADTVLGLLVAAFAGFCIGSSGWSFKAIRRLPFEVWMLVCFATMLVVVPWSTVLLYYPRPFDALAGVGAWTLLKANLFAFAWGFGNVLCVVGFIRVGVALTNGVMGGVGLAVGVTIPMVFKGTGVFSHAKDVGSPAGLIILAGVAVMLAGVALAALAGNAREMERSTRTFRQGGFRRSLALLVVAGVLSAGLTFTFAYSQGPIAAAMERQRPGQMPATLAVWAAGTLAGAAVNCAYALALIAKNRSWPAFVPAWRELVIPLLGGCQCCLGIVLMAKGSLMLGVMGASVGWGVFEGVQIMGGQLVGFATGEWRGATSGPRRKMIAALAVILAAAVVMAYGNSRA